MGSAEFNKIFSNRLQYYLSLNNMTQLDLSKKLGVGTTSVSNWCNGLKTPRMDKVDAMCEIFGCRRRDLMEMPSDESDNLLPNCQRILTQDESDLLDDFQKLNAEGKSEARKQVRNLTKIEDYTKDTGSSASAAG